MNRPLLRVVLTSGADTLPGLEAAAAAHGFTVRRAPLFTFGAPASWAEVDTALERLHAYGAIAMTSPRSSQAIVGRARYLGLRSCPIPVWCGRSCRELLMEIFTDVRCPSERAAGSRGLGAAIADAIRQDGADPVLFPCGQTHRRELPQLLTAAGRQVDSVICYRTIVAGPDSCAAALHSADVIVATSPVIAQLLAASRPLSGAPVLVALGPTTAEAAAAAGWAPDATANQPTAPAVAAALQTLLMRRS